MSSFVPEIKDWIAFDPPDPERLDAWLKKRNIVGITGIDSIDSTVTQGVSVTSIQFVMGTDLQKATDAAAELGSSDVAMMTTALARPMAFISTPSTTPRRSWRASGSNSSPWGCRRR